MFKISPKNRWFAPQLHITDLRTYQALCKALHNAWERLAVCGIPEQVKNQWRCHPGIGVVIEGGVVALGIFPFAAAAVLKDAADLDLDFGGLRTGHLPVDGVIRIPVGLREDESEWFDFPVTADYAGDRKAAGLRRRRPHRVAGMTR